MEEFYVCTALFTEEFSMLYSTSGLQFYRRIHLFTEDKPSCEVHNLKETPTLFLCEKKLFQGSAISLAAFLAPLLSRKEINMLESSLSYSPCSSW